MKYSDNGFWVEALEDGNYRIGLSEKGQDDLGDVAFFEFLEIENITPNESFISVEASKATTELTAPLHARVVLVNNQLEQNPQLLNSLSIEDNWIAIVSHVSNEEFNALQNTSGL